MRVTQLNYQVRQLTASTNLKFFMSDGGAGCYDLSPDDRSGGSVTVSTRRNAYVAFESDTGQRGLGQRKLGEIGLRAE